MVLKTGPDRPVRPVDRGPVFNPVRFLKKIGNLKKMTKNRKSAVRSGKLRISTVEPVMVWFCQFQNLLFWNQKLHRFDSPKFGARDLMLRIISNFILNRLESMFQVKLMCRAGFRNGCVKCLMWKKKKKKKVEIVGSYGGERKRKKKWWD